ncbi:MAG: peptidoglycan DD-metalloendopeptidase family protein [Pseudomonadota bacterium]
MRTLATILAVLLGGLATPISAQDTQIKELQLREVRQKISKLQRSLEDKGRRREKLDRSLKAAESELLAIRSRLAATRADQAQNETELKRINGESTKAKARLAEHTAQLVSQLRAAYTGGRTERLRLMLNQQNPADFGRTMTYYRYLNAYRKGNIDAVAEQIQELVGLANAAKRTRDQLAALQARHEKELAERDETRQRRAELLKNLSDEIKREGGQVAELRQQEADLERLILELSSILADYPISSEEAFPALKGKLTWPVAGRMLHEFGQPREESALTWNGVLLGAPRGKEVRALYHGRVAYADWLPGLGLLLVLDHGDGYMSLYGHNDSLLQDVGNWVAAGDPVATVGDSGGQAQAGLYLEIRQGTRALNPRRWISKTPRE